MIKVLSDFDSKGLCGCVKTNLKRYSVNDLTICNNISILDHNWDDFDIVHINTCSDVAYNKAFNTTAKVIFDIHAFFLSCPNGGLFCSVLNKFLEEPLTCTNCLGHLGIYTGEANLRKFIKLARKSDILAVHSEFMKEFYSVYNPTLFPIPFETDLLNVCTDKEDYIFYTGRLSIEKNPFGFVDIINKTGLKGKMAIYHLENKDTNKKSYYKDILESKNENLEVILNPNKEEMIDLVKHAKFTVLPYFFNEPLGIAPINSILCGTPLIAFPYGNYRNLTHLLPKTLDEMISMVKMDDKQYRETMKRVLIKSSELRTTHDPKRVIGIWDGIYRGLCE